MAFGTVLASYPAPGSAISVHALAWDGARLWIGDFINSTVMKCDPTSLTIVGTFGLASGAFPAQWVGGKLLVVNGAIWAQFWRPGEGTAAASTTTIASGAASSFTGLAGITGGKLIGLSNLGRLNSFAPVPGTLWALVDSIGPPMAVGPTAMATDGARVYVGTGAGGLVRYHLPSFSLIDSIAGPGTAGDRIDGLALAGAYLWVGVGGATDRIYKLSMY